MREENIGNLLCFFFNISMECFNLHQANEEGNHGNTLIIIGNAFHTKCV